MAQTISWAPLNVSPVPISPAAMLILALSLFVIAKYFVKSKHHIRNSMFILTTLIGTLFVGASILDNKAFAVIFGSIVNIDTPSGTEHLAINGITQVTNNYSNPIRITAIDPEGCSITSNACTVGVVLNNSESCEITTSSCSAPVILQSGPFD